jgi:TonB family protein
MAFVQEREPRLWLMLAASIGIHAVVGLTAARAVSSFQFEGPRQGQTSVSVSLVAANSAAEATPPAPAIEAAETSRKGSNEPHEQILAHRAPTERVEVAAATAARAREALAMPTLRRTTEEEELKPTPIRRPRHAAREIASVPDADSEITLTSAASEGSHQAIEISTRVEPRYPPDLWRRRITGSVDILATLDAEGRVISAQVFKSSGHAEFDESAMEAVRQWRAKPLTTLASDATQDVILPVSFRFK